MLTSLGLRGELTPTQELPIPQEMMEGLGASDQLSPVPTSPKVLSLMAMIPLLCFSILPFNRIGHPGEMKAIGGQKPGGMEAMGRLAGKEPAPSSRSSLRMLLMDIWRKPSCRVRIAGPREPMLL